MWAITHKHEGTVQVLLKAGADVNQHDLLGGSALIVAAGNGDAAMIETLLKAGADIRYKDNDGNTALRWAEHNGHNDAAKVLKKWT